MCKLSRLYPDEDDVHAAIVDSLCCEEEDMTSAWSAVKYSHRTGMASLDEETKARLQAEIAATAIPRHLQSLERFASKSSTGWLADTLQPSCCDFAWGTTLRQIQCDETPGLPPSLLKPFPGLSAFVVRFCALPAVAEYYNSFIATPLAPAVVPSASVPSATVPP